MFSLLVDEDRSEGALNSFFEVWNGHVDQVFDPTGSAPLELRPDRANHWRDGQPLLRIQNLSEP
jgi:hypothetical protein